MSDQNDSLPPDLAELGHIAAAADSALDAGSAVVPAGAVAEPAPQVDRAQELAAMVGLAVSVAAPALPFLPACYTPEVCGQIGTALDAVATKYGWNLEGLNSPELALAAVSIPPTITAVVMARQHFAAKRAQAQAEQQARTVDVPAGPVPRADLSGHAGTVIQPGAVG